jgi:hypothetical protein
MDRSSLEAVQSELDAKGVRSVMFFFSPEMKSMALSDAKNMVASVLGSCLHSERVKYAGVGDKHLVTAI